MSRNDSDPEPSELNRDWVERLVGLRANVRNLDNISQSVFSSASWRAGQRLAGLLRRLGVRIPVSTAELEMQRLIAELRDLAEMPDLSRRPDPVDVVLGKHFRVSENRPLRFPAAPLPRPLHWDVGQSALNQLAEELERWSARPVISVVVPVHNTPNQWLAALLESVRAQFYPYWQLCLVDDGSTLGETRQALRNLDKDPRILLVEKPSAGGISVATNAGIKVASGDYIAFVDHDDTLEPDALLQIARAIVKTGADLVYTDEDKLDEAEIETNDPHYKPAWSPDLLLSQNYISHLTVIKRSLIDQAGGLDPEFDGSQDHDLLLRCSEKANEIVHVPMALYHWRAVKGSTAREFGEKSYPWEAGRKAVGAALDRRTIAGRAERGERPGTYRIHREITDAPRVSILIPFRDQAALLRQCILSILEKTAYERYEIIGLDNQSREASTHAVMRELVEADERVQFERYDHPFNFSAINNFGATLAKGEHLLFLNNDTEVVASDWLGAMLAHSQRDEVGAVGAKLLYPDDRIQHAGVILGIGGVAGHSHKYLDKSANGYFSRPHLTQNVSAVTGACLMVKEYIFRELEGFEEQHLAIAFNDIDFCIRMRARGLLNVYEPAAELYHHESISRGYEDSDEKQNRFSAETKFMQSRHALVLAETDPYYSPNLSHHNEGFTPRD